MLSLSQELLIMCYKKKYKRDTRKTQHRLQGERLPQMEHSSICTGNFYVLSLAHSYRLGTKWQRLLRTRKAIREFPKPWLSIIILLQPSTRSTAGVLSSVFFHHTATQNCSTFFHHSFLSFFHPVKNEILMLSICIGTNFTMKM